MRPPTGTAWSCQPSTPATAARPTGEAVGALPQPLASCVAGEQCGKLPAWPALPSMASRSRRPCCAGTPTQPAACGPPTCTTPSARWTRAQGTSGGRGWAPGSAGGQHVHLQRACEPGAWRVHSERARAAPAPLFGASRWAPPSRPVPAFEKAMARLSHSPAAGPSPTPPPPHSNPAGRGTSPAAPRGSLSLPPAQAAVTRTTAWCSAP